MSQMHTRSSVRAAEPAVSEKFGSIIVLPENTFVEQLKTRDYKQIQELRRFQGISVKGARAELERRILEFKSKFDAGEIQLPSGAPGDSHVSVSTAGIEAVSTPERREGRKRSPHRGNTAVSWPTVAPFPGVAANPIDPLSQSDPC